MSHKPQIQKSCAMVQKSAVARNKNQSGSMIVMALFVLVVLTLLAGTMITLISGSNRAVISEVYGLRAQQAAHAGIESLIANSFPAGASSQSCNTNITITASFSNINGFKNCSFSASCRSQEISFNSETHRYYRYSSTGLCDTGAGIVSRTLYVDAMQEEL
uniref:type II secretory pathway component n=1 Tax=Ningiella ruwaisensis TaxID=2364274 RepID=UPI001447AB0B|nr:type II secretory pathway component [Ningiella ruwaisensis]